MDLSVIIVNFNTKDLLEGCLGSVIGARRQEVEIIVIDNGSTDGSVEEISSFAKATEDRKNFKLKFILNRGNLGFARANNQGIRIAEGEYILLLNSDTEVRMGVLERLVEFAKEHPGAGMIGARLLNPDGSIQPSIYHFPTIWRAIKEYWFGQKGAYEKYAVTASDAVEVEAVTGAAMLIPKKTIEKIGFLDERYFMYFEDLDFCRRVQRAGFKVYYLPRVEIIHHHGKSATVVGGQAYKWLCQSSKIYNGRLKYSLLYFVIWIGQKWQRVFGQT